MKTNLFTAILMTATLISCEKNTTVTPQGFQEIVINKTTADIIQSDNEFGLAMFREVISGDPESDNIFVSPTSIALALAMTYNGAAGETKTAMESALRKVGFTAEEINASYKSLIDALVSVDPKVLLEIANSIWYREGFTVLQDFVTTNQQYYNARVSSIDFDDAAAPGLINDWVSENTHGKIIKIVDDIKAQTVMYLINAIYFKGIWQTEFKKENTSDGPFYLSSGSPLTVPVMKQTTTLRYTSNEVFSMAEIPYGQGNYSMLVMLPQNGLSADDIVNTLTPESWDTWMGELTERNVDLELPKFTFEYKNELNNELEAMGMGIAFLDGLADFSKINGSGGLFISKVLHKSFVEVNEEGTEAAAVTSVEIELTSVGPEPQVTEFHVDRPFLFAIRETSTGTILFIGRVNNPLTKANG